METSTFERVCVEVLLQRTRADSVASVYASFFGRFGGWPDIAKASIGELEEHLKPIGLWRRRAISLNGLAIYAAKRDGMFPDDPVELGKVPGVGQYMRNAILLFQHGATMPLIDVNMARVLERFVRPRVLADIRYDPWLQAACHWLVRDKPIETNWATLDFAASVCVARRPACQACQVLPLCRAAGEASSCP